MLLSGSIFDELRMAGNGCKFIETMLVLGVQVAKE
jgi:hypothetical protein